MGFFYSRLGVALNFIIHRTKKETPESSLVVYGVVK